ncbi:MAG: peptidylprolyl isomerase [Polyangiaceae bacterium]|nr:peptidylprolyl isomerase [Polyangiaceae bacterium]
MVYRKPILLTSLWLLGSSVFSSSHSLGENKEPAKTAATSLADRQKTAAPSGGQEEQRITSVLGQLNIDGEELLTAIKYCERDQPQLNEAECLNDYWVPHWLLAKKTKLSAYETNRILALEFKRSLLAEVALPSEDELNRAIGKAAAQYAKPERVRVFRILLSTEKEAIQLLRDLPQRLTPEKFRQLARSHSIDEATRQRGGDLGFLWPDGRTDIPQVQADASLYQAASKLADGQLSNEPIKEKAGYALLWRRGSLPKVALTPAEARSYALARSKRIQSENVFDITLEELRNSHLQSYRPQLLEVWQKKQP